MVQVERADWKKWIERSKTDLSGGLTANDDADILSKKAEYLCPEFSLALKTTQVKSAELQKSINNIQSLVKINEKLFGIQSFEEFNMEGLTASQVKTIESEYEKLDTFLKKNPVLQLDSILNYQSIQPAMKGKSSLTE